MNHLFVDNLTVIDFAYLDHHRGLVGESWIVDVVLAGELDEQGMVFDFGSVKRTIKRVIDERVDHRLVVPKDQPGLQVREHGDRAEIECPLADGSVVTHGSPLEAVLLIRGHKVVPSAVSALLQDELRAVLPANVTGIDVHLREEEIDGPYYHYVHGLKKHLGNCQRIAHGHRSRIQIQRNHARDQQLEREWARRWQDIYIGTEEDVTARFVEDDISYLSFTYEANQGEFSLTLPASRVYLMETDTTVELIAAHLGDACKRTYGEDEIQVKAFEGVGKGALAIR
ncbi:6-pyruvoyl trahydropterin synthase family protein [Marinobacter fonticola]|uniref:6-pyruvoyl trahydropterin synthase family protein n=1 Tax=Marinobacter fonticola TaxID=2603215 RepID=UPI0011E62245|nr:6-carboxytetrahydropterin synthase [Marinobacter fonticola]